MNDYYRPTTNQVKAYTSSSAAIDNAVGSQTRYVRIYCTTAAHVAIGASPTATTSSMPVAAGVAEIFKINPGEKVAAIQSASGGNLHVTELTK